MNDPLNYKLYSFHIAQTTFEHDPSEPLTAVDAAVLATVPEALALITELRSAAFPTAHELGFGSDYEQGNRVFSIYVSFQHMVRDQDDPWLSVNQDCTALREWLNDNGFEKLWNLPEKWWWRKPIDETTSDELWRIIKR